MYSFVVGKLMMKIAIVEVIIIIRLSMSLERILLMEFSERTNEIIRDCLMTFQQNGEQSGG